MSEPSHRLREGGQIDRSRPISFQFDGKSFQGFAGDTLASALVANGVSLVGRSFKYHRPRGLLTAGSEEPNALVELRGGARREPNTRATTIELFEGLEARSQNRFPSLALDLLSVNGLAAPILGAGFYYKTFMWPRALWEKLYEPLIRRAAGLGRASGQPDPDIYEKAYAFCDVLIAGGGPAGLAAALGVGEAGLRVILCDEDLALGGRLNSERQTIDSAAATDWARKAEARLRAMPNVRVWIRSTVFGVYDGQTYGVLERVGDHLAEPSAFQPRQRLWQIVAKQMIVATGALERPIVFGGNDLPGVMLASAVRSYVNRFAALPGRKVAVFTATDDGWRTARDLIAVGTDVTIIDPRAEIAPSVRALVGAETPVHLGAQVLEARGFQRVRSIDVRQSSGQRLSLAIDLLAVSGGFNPALGLTTHLGDKPVWSDAHAAFLPGGLPAGMMVAGACAGHGSLADCLADGDRAGRAAAQALGLAPQPLSLPQASPEASSLVALFSVSGSRKKAFVDLQNDVTRGDVEQAALEGFQSVEHLKRYTTLGMATDQGKTSNMAGLAILAELTGRTIPQTGSTRFRPPQVPVAIGAFAGMHRGKAFRPTRFPSGHEWAAEQGATFVEAGQWLRAQWFARDGETDWLQTVTREVNAVRGGVGICDVSTLGKIALSGSDAGAFLDRVYCNRLSTLAIGKARYGLMLREDGFVLDDGTVARLDADNYVLSTTTANAAKVMQHLEYCHQVLWPDQDVVMVSVTEQWAQYAIAGPRSRELLQVLFSGEQDLSDPAVPYMAVREFRLAGLPVRLFRISFSGELAYELAIPARFGDWLARALMAAGRDLGVVPYGTEALGVMRVEKGHVAGNELSGQTVARDLGLGRMMSTQKDYIGRVMAGRPALVDPDRPSLTGFLAVDPSARLRAGAHFIRVGVIPSPEADEGYMTSVAFSPTLRRWIGLGLLKRGPERIGERVRAYDPIRGGDIELEIVPPVFVDPEGERLHG